MSMEGGISRGRFRTIDYLRGIAAIAVVIYHVRIYLWIGSKQILANADEYNWLDRVFATIMAPTYFFDSGVILFFVISGFCIHWPVATLLQSETEGRSQVPTLGGTFWRGYLVRRLLRIYPPYLAAILVTMAFEVGASHLSRFDQTPGPLVWHSFFMAQNYLPPQGQMIGNPALWSVPVEVELYLAYPAVLLARKWFGWRATLTILAGTSVAVSFLAAHGQNVLHGNFLKFWSVWAAGAWLAESVSQDRLDPFGRWHGTLMGGAGGLGLAAAVTGWGREISHLLLGIAFVFLLWWRLSRELREGKGPESKPARALRQVGKASYSLYLTHYPVFYLLGALWMAIMLSKPVSAGIPFVAVCLAVAVSFAFHKVVEKPSHQLARRAAGAIREVRSSTVPNAFKARES